MDIKVIGSGCAECTVLYNNVCEAAKQLGITDKVERVEELIDMVRLGVMVTPSVMINGKLVISGRVPRTPKLVEIIKENM